MVGAARKVVIFKQSIVECFLFFRSRKILSGSDPKNRNGNGGLRTKAAASRCADRPWLLERSLGENIRALADSTLASGAWGSRWAKAETKRWRRINKFFFWCWIVSGGRGLGHASWGLLAVGFMDGRSREEVGRKKKFPRQKSLALDRVWALCVHGPAPFWDSFLHQDQLRPVLHKISMPYAHSHGKSQT